MWSACSSNMIYVYIYIYIYIHIYIYNVIYNVTHHVTPNVWRPLVNLIFHVCLQSNQIAVPCGVQAFKSCRVNDCESLYCDWMLFALLVCEKVRMLFFELLHSIVCMPLLCFHLRFCTTNGPSLQSASYERLQRAVLRLDAVGFACLLQDLNFVYGFQHSPTSCVPLTSCKHSRFDGKQLTH